MQKLTIAMALIVFVVLIVFIASNTQSVMVSFATVKLEAPVAFVALGAAVSGVVLWPLLRAMFARSRAHSVQ